MDKKSVAFLITNMHGGGAQRALSNITNQLDPSRFEVFIIVFEDLPTSYPINSKLLNLNTASTGNLFKKIINVFKRYHRLKKLKKQYKFDTVVSFLPTPNIVNLLTKRKNQKTIISVRNFVSLNNENKFVRVNHIFRKKYYNKADLIISVSDEIKSSLISSYGIDDNKIQIINNGYPIKTIEKSKEEKIEEVYQSLFDIPTVITSGRLSKQKGQWLLIEAFSMVLKSHPKAKLIILGTGAYLEKLKKQAKALKIESSVHFLGFQDNPFKFINQSHIFVLPSLFEGFPNVLAEAMVCKTAVISTDCPSGPKEILSNNSLDKPFGILLDRPVQSIELKDNQHIINQLANSINQLLSSTSLREDYALRGYNRIKTFDIETIVKQWEKVL